jgi:hypothetical protein
MMVKMDVEGYEEEVPRGAQALLANEQLKIIDLEWPTSSIRQVLKSAVGWVVKSAMPPIGTNRKHDTNAV